MFGISSINSMIQFSFHLSNFTGLCDVTLKKPLKVQNVWSVTNEKEVGPWVILDRRYEQFKKVWWFCIHLRKLQQKFEFLNHLKYEKLVFSWGVASMAFVASLGDKILQHPGEKKNDFHKSQVRSSGFNPPRPPTNAFAAFASLRNRDFRERQSRVNHSGNLSIKLDIYTNYTYTVYVYLIWQYCVKTYTWIFQVCKICAFSPKKPTKKHKFYIYGRSRYIYIYTYMCVSICLYLYLLIFKKKNTPFCPAV